MSEFDQNSDILKLINWAWDYDVVSRGQLDQKQKVCYMCNGTGILQSDEECACFTGKCECQYCEKGRE